MDESTGLRIQRLGVRISPGAPFFPQLRSREYDSRMATSWDERKAKFLARKEKEEPGFRKKVESRRKAREEYETGKKGQQSQQQKKRCA